MATDLRREADELARYWGELGRRVVASGVGGLGDVLGLQAQLRQSLAGVSHQEITWAQQQAARLVTTLEGLAEQLRAVRTLKDALERSDVAKDALERSDLAKDALERSDPI